MKAYSKPPCDRCQYWADNGDYFKVDVPNSNGSMQTVFRPPVCLARPAVTERILFELDVHVTNGGRWMCTTEPDILPTVARTEEELAEVEEDDLIGGDPGASRAFTLDRAPRRPAGLKPIIAYSKHKEILFRTRQHLIWEVLRQILDDGMGKYVCPRYRYQEKDDPDFLIYCH